MLITDLMDIHANVNVRDEVAPAGCFKLVTLCECIDGANDDVAGLKKLGLILPTTRMRLDDGPRIDFKNSSLGRTAALLVYGRRCRGFDESVIVRFRFDSFA